MDIFVDLHHSDLFFSLHLLLEKRMGFNLYRPIGLDWFHNGYWQIAKPYGNAMDTVGQYLDIGNSVWDQYKNLNGNYQEESGIYRIWEPVHQYHQKAITFEKFKQMKFDAIISTVDLHDHCYEDLRNKFQPQAKIIAQLGNIGQKTHLPNVIHSVPYTGNNQNTVLVHQELDPDIYTLSPVKCTNTIYSVVNCFQYPQIYNKYKSLLPDVNMKYYGASSPDGSLFGCRGVAEKMREADLGWHLKSQGGLGHSAMGWMFSGRGVVCNMSQHKRFGGTTALSIFEPGVTCYDIESHSEQENCKNLRSLLQPENCIKMGENARKRFVEVINYDKEEADFRRFWGNLR